jgi:hypothetical protein
LKLFWIFSNLTEIKIWKSGLIDLCFFFQNLFKTIVANKRLVKSINYNAALLVQNVSNISSVFWRSKLFSTSLVLQKAHRFDHISFHSQFFHLYLPESCCFIWNYFSNNQISVKLKHYQEFFLFLFLTPKEAWIFYPRVVFFLKHEELFVFNQWITFFFLLYFHWESIITKFDFLIELLSFISHTLRFVFMKEISFSLLVSLWRARLWYSDFSCNCFH